MDFCDFNSQLERIVRFDRPWEPHFQEKNSGVALAFLFRKLADLCGEIRINADGHVSLCVTCQCCGDLTKPFAEGLFAEEEVLQRIMRVVKFIPRRSAA